MNASRISALPGALSRVWRERGKLPLSLRIQEALWFYVFISPWIFGFLIFTFLPMVASLLLGFTRYNAIEPPEFIGLRNFQFLLQDAIYWMSVRVTLINAVISVPLTLVISLFLALLLNQRVPGLRVIRTIYYLPSIFPAVVAALVWIFMFNPTFGILNYILHVFFRIQGPNWLGSERWVLPAVIISGLWGMGSGVIIFLASLQGVPHELYEAAELDGAGMVHRFWNVTLPMISPVILYNLLIGTIFALQIFARIFVLTGGGPNYASYFYNIYIYENAFSFFRLGLASAQAWILFVVILLLTLIMLKTSFGWVHYEGGH